MNKQERLVKVFLSNHSVLRQSCMDTVRSSFSDHHLYNTVENLLWAATSQYWGSSFKRLPPSQYNGTSIEWSAHSQYSKISFERPLPSQYSRISFEQPQFFSSDVSLKRSGCKRIFWHAFRNRIWTIHSKKFSKTDHCFVAVTCRRIMNGYPL